MRVKNKFHFFIGLFCLLCFVIGIVNHTDTLVSVSTGIAAFAEIYIGLFCEAEDNAKVLETISDTVKNTSNMAQNKDTTYMNLTLNEILTVLCDMSTSLAVIADSLSKEEFCGHYKEVK